MPATPKKNVPAVAAPAANLELAVAELYPASKSESLGLSREDFAIILGEIVAKYASGSA